MEGKQREIFQAGAFSLLLGDKDLAQDRFYSRSKEWGDDGNSREYGVSKAYYDQKILHNFDRPNEGQPWNMLEVDKDTKKGQYKPTTRQVSQQDLLTEIPTRVHSRIIFLQNVELLTVDDIKCLSRQFDIPSAFWDFFGNGPFGRQRSSQRIGGKIVEYDNIWLQICHFVVESDPEKPKSHFASPSFFLKQRRTASWGDDFSSEILFICLETAHTPFGLRDAFLDAYSDPGTSARLLEDPYGLFAIILSQLNKWSLKVFIELEKLVSDQEAKEPTYDPFNRNPHPPRKSSNSPDFWLLHSISKYIIQSSDAVEARINTLSSLQKTHSAILNSRKTPSSAATDDIEAALGYHRDCFNGVVSRLKNLEKRINNHINLVFNLIKQREAIFTQAQNSSMSTVSSLTLITLPVTALASIFSTPFFEMDTQSHLRISPDLKVFLGLILPVTVFITLLWLWRNSLVEGHLPGSKVRWSKFPNFRKLKIPFKERRKEVDIEK